jgi:mannose-6-phosphate isomerase-like protein (cupin superfamily)
MSIGYVTNIEEETLQNDYYRKVLYTVPAKHTGKFANPGIQLTVMTIEPGEDIGWERHEHVNQFLRIEEGNGIVQFVKGKKKETYDVDKSSAIIIPAGTDHNIYNTSEQKPLKLYSIYTPPNHPPNAREESPLQHPFF